MKPAEMTDEQLAESARKAEIAINRCQDWKMLPSLNKMFQGIIDEQARRDLIANPPRLPNHKMTPSRRRKAEEVYDD